MAGHMTSGIMSMGILASERIGAGSVACESDSRC
jgi:hypothetical protein